MKRFVVPIWMAVTAMLTLGAAVSMPESPQGRDRYLVYYAAIYCQGDEGSESVLQLYCHEVWVHTSVSEARMMRAIRDAMARYDEHTRVTYEGEDRWCANGFVNAIKVDATTDFDGEIESLRTKLHNHVLGFVPNEWYGVFATVEASRMKSFEIK